MLTRPCSQGESRRLIGQSGLFATSRCGIVTNLRDVRGTRSSNLRTVRAGIPCALPGWPKRAMTGMQGWDMRNIARVPDDEALRLVSAFLQIHEPERRRKLLDIAERMARRSVKPVGTLPIVSQDNEM